MNSLVMVNTVTSDTCCVTTVTQWKQRGLAPYTREYVSQMPAFSAPGSSNRVTTRPIGEIPGLLALTLCLSSQTAVPSPRCWNSRPLCTEPGFGHLLIPWTINSTGLSTSNHHLISKKNWAHTSPTLFLPPGQNGIWLENSFHVICWVLAFLRERPLRSGSWKLLVEIEHGIMWQGRDLFYLLWVIFPSYLSNIYWQTVRFGKESDAIVVKI